MNSLRYLNQSLQTTIVTTHTPNKADWASAILPNLADINLRLEYRLSKKSREWIWRCLLESVTSMTIQQLGYRPEDIDTLAQYEINGHRIKYVVGIMHAAGPGLDWSDI